MKKNTMIIVNTKEMYQTGDPVVVAVRRPRTASGVLRILREFGDLFWKDHDYVWFDSNGRELTDIDIERPGRFYGTDINGDYRWFRN